MLNLIIVHFFGLLSPGPDFFYVSRKAAVGDRRDALGAVLGITFGVLFWSTATILGLAILFAKLPVLQSSVMALGGAYLFYLGLKLLGVKQNVSFDENGEKYSHSFLKEIWGGLLVNLSNAKIVVYFASVMSFVLVGLQEIWQIYTALIIIVVETFLYFYVISLLFSRPLAKRFYSQYSRYVDNVSGVIFTLFGSYLIYQGISHII